jgi:type VI secretion system protein VasG
VPYLPLSDTVLKAIIELQLKKIRNRIRDNHKATFEYDAKVVEAIAARCKEVESGARNVDHIMTKTLLPAIASEILARKAEGRTVSGVKVDTDDTGAFKYAIE